MNNLSSVVKLGLLIAILLGYTGCGVKSENKVIFTMSKKDMAKTIIKGKTKKKEISKALGEPQSVDFTGAGDEKWIYKNIASTAKLTNFIPIVDSLSSGTDDKTRTLVIIFYKQGVVSNYSYSISEGETVSGLIGN